jgi:hypothetical protein
MNVALLQLSEKHTEIIGGVITMLLRDSVSTINVFTKKYYSSFVPYYKKLFDKKIIHWFFFEDTNESLYKEVNKNDVIIFLTGYDYEDFETPAHKTLLINHSVDHIKEYKNFKTCGQVALTPIFKPKKIPFFLNVFNVEPSFDESDKMEIFITGLTNPANKDLDKLEELFEKLHQRDNTLPNGRVVKFNIINYYEIEEQFNKYVDSGLLDIYVDAKANEMMKMLKRSAFAMVIARENSTYHKKQLSGVIPLAISLGVPLLCDNKIAKIYGVSRVSVIHNYNGDYLYRALVNASNKDLTTLKHRVIAFRDKTIIRNKKLRLDCNYKLI